MPRVSVIIATFNGSLYIADAVDSVLKQTFPDYEIIVVDDGSTDVTPEILARYGSKLRIIRQQNRGGVAARNRGYRAAKGSYIVLLDHDDRLLPDHLALLSSYLDAHPEFGVAYGDTHLINSQGRRIRLLSRTHPPASGWVFDDLVYRNRISVNAAMVRRDCVDEVGGLHVEGINYIADWDLWVRLAEKFPFHYVGMPVAELRFHDRMSRKSFPSEFLLEEAISTFERFMVMPSFASVSVRARGECYWGCGYRLVLVGDWRRGQYYLLKAVYLDPFNVKVWLVLVSSIVGPLPLRLAAKLKRWAFHTISPLR